jgi:hypothetical protein
VHHLLEWEHGGTTDLSNLVLLCRRHHVAVHEGGNASCASLTARSGSNGGTGAPAARVAHL